MSEAYFAKQVSISQEEIEYYKELVGNPPPSAKVHLAYFNMYRNLYGQFSASYSLGIPIDEFSGLYTSMIESLVGFRQSAPIEERLFFNGEVDEYMAALTLVSWGVTLSAPQQLFDQLVTLIDSENQHDGLLDLLIASRQPQRKLSTSTVYPKLYQPLYDAVQQPVSKEGVANFLTHWYETCLKQTSSYNMHRKHGGEDSGFNGYWAWEVAGLTRALNIDDSTYRAMPYYPVDLVTYSRW